MTRLSRILRCCVPVALIALGEISCSTRFPAPSVATSGVPVVRQPMARRAKPASPASNAADVWVISDPLHTGLVVPLAWLERHGFRTPASVRGAKYVNFSWGDRVAYLQERWLTPWEAFDALFIPGEAVMEIIAINYDPRYVYPSQRVYHGRVAEETGASMAGFLHYCARFDGSGRWKVVGPSTWGRGSLVESQHTYGFPRFCNSFTAGALESCGMRFGPWSETTADALLAACVRQGFERLPDLTEEEWKLVRYYSGKHAR